VRPIEFEYIRHFRFGQRPVQEISLDRVTPQIPQELQLSRGFHPFGDHSEPEAMGHCDYRAGDLFVTGVGGDIPDE
jgi:hypothetical protein